MYKEGRYLVVSRDQGYRGRTEARIQVWHLHCLQSRTIQQRHFNSKVSGQEPRTQVPIFECH